MKLFFQLSLWLLLCTTIIKGEPRTFTNTEGRKIEAEIVSVAEDLSEVTIKSNGKTFTIPPTTLSLEDQEYIIDWLKQSYETDKAATQTTASGEPTLEALLSETEPFVLELKAGDRIEGPLPVANRSIKIELTKAATTSRGMIVQIGDAKLGLSLQIKKDGVLHLTHTQKDGSRFITAPLIGETFDISAKLDEKGLSLVIDKNNPYTVGKIPLLTSNPAPGLSVGHSFKGVEEDKFEGSFEKLVVTVY